MNEFKICKECLENKSIDRYIKSSKVCRTCVMKKDYANAAIRKKAHYERNKERIKAKNLETYHRTKVLKKQINDNDSDDYDKENEQCI
jgi:hypothetical protein